MSMKDDKYLLMKQCIRDAFTLAEQVKGNWSWSSNASRHDTVATLACSLFMERSTHPATVETVKALLMGGEETVQVTEELKGKYLELSEVMVQVEKAQHELEKIKEQVAHQRSINYLQDTIGTEAYAQLIKEGYFEIRAKNGGVYKISKDGGVAKFHPNFRGKWTMYWHGRIDPSEELPMPDAIATIYAHILKNPDKFDQDKGCGNIHVRAE